MQSNSNDRSEREYYENHSSRKRVVCSPTLKIDFLFCLFRLWSSDLKTRQSQADSDLRTTTK